jgi:hypothetical protein
VISIRAASRRVAARICAHGSVRRDAHHTKGDCAAAALGFANAAARGPDERMGREPEP